MRSASGIPLLTMALLGLLLLSSPAAGELLYDVDFDTPPHTVGLPPVTGTGPAPRATPTTINFGDPTVVAALGAMTDQPCAFGNGTTGYDQLGFVCAGPSYPGGFPTAYDFYRVETQVLVASLGSPSTNLTLLLDTPSVKRIDFKGSGDIMIWPGSLTIGTYTPGVPFLVEVDLDIAGDSWTIYLDGTEAHSGAMVFDELRTVRMHLNGDYATDSGAFDEFKVHGGAVTSADDGGAFALVGASLRQPFLRQNTPNPFNPCTEIEFELGSAGRASLRIYDIAGRFVRTLVDGELAAGGHEVVWNGVDDGGRRVAAGVFLYQLVADGMSTTRRMVVLK